MGDLCGRETSLKGTRPEQQEYKVVKEVTKPKGG